MSILLATLGIELCLTVYRSVVTNPNSLSLNHRKIRHSRRDGRMYRRDLRPPEVAGRVTSHDIVFS